MKFSEAYNEMLKGNKIARAGWKGYWYIHPQTGELIIHLASGEELVNTSDNLKQTIENTLAEDWMIFEYKPVEETINKVLKVI